MPIVRKIGDVVRVHRAIVKEFRGIKQFNVNLQFNSSWCLFHSSDIMLRDQKGQVQDPEPYSQSDSDEMETEMGDGTVRSDRQIEKSEKRKYTPYKFSGKSYSFDFQQEKLIVDGLRNWEDLYFQKSSWIFKTMSQQLAKLKDLASNKEIDLLVKVLKIFEKDEYTLEMRIKDTSNEMWFIQIPKLKFG